MTDLEVWKVVTYEEFVREWNTDVDQQTGVSDRLTELQERRGDIGETEAKLYDDA